jgi:hypothetical protein
VKLAVVLVLVAGAAFVGRHVRTHPRQQRWLAAALGFLPFLLLSLNVASHETYRGSSRGFEVTLLDLAAWALLIALPRSERVSKTRTLYLAVCLASISVAAMPLYATFGVWKVLRMYLVAAAAYRATVAGWGPALLQGVVVGQVYAFGLALEQRYLLGLHQVSGPFAHQNGLAQASILVYAVCLSVLLGRQPNRWALVGTLAASASVVMTLSRGGMAMLILCSLLIFAFAAFRHRNPRLVRVAVLGMLAGVAVWLKAGDTIVDRFLDAPDASAEARHHFEDMAAMMVDDYPVLGVGMNNYSYANEFAGYADAADVPDIDRGGVAHHVFWLTLAELGYVGLVAFVLVYLVPVLRSLRATLAAGRSARGDVLQGMALGVAAILVQGTLEYTLRLTMVSQLVWCYVGVMSALVAVRARIPRAASIRPA